MKVNIQKAFRAIIPMLTICVLAFNCFVVPAYALEISEVDISGCITDQVYEGDDVLTTYNLPLKPHSDIYGMRTGATATSYIGSSTNIKFSQDLNATSGPVTFFNTSLYYEANSLLMNGGYYYGYTSALNTQDIPYSKLTTMIVNDIEYPIAGMVLDGNIYYIANYENATEAPSQAGEYQLMLGTNVNYVYFATYENAKATITLGFYDTKIDSASEYEYIWANSYPLGFSGDMYNVIDISDLRTGYNYNITFDYIFDVSTIGASGGTACGYYVHFLDSNKDEVSVESGTLGVDSVDGDATFTHTISLTVPEGAEYFYIRFNTGQIDVQECASFDLRITKLEMVVPLSSSESSAKQEQEQTTWLGKIWESITGLPQLIASNIKGFFDNVVNTINKGINNIITGSADDQAAADDLAGSGSEIGDKTNTAIGELDSAGDVLGSISQPEISIDSLVPGELLGTSYVNYVNVLSCTWTDPTLTQMMVIMASMVIISLLLFGKKG